MEHIGKQKRIKGLTLFEFNKTTNEIKPAKLERTWTGYKVVINKDCFYIQALNAKNAKRKLIQKRICYE